MEHDIQKLSSQDIEKALEQLQDRWGLREGKLFCRVECNGFSEVQMLVERIMRHAEEVHHHPDVLFSYKFVEVSLSTHDAGGVTDADIGFAAFIDSVA